MSDWQKRSQEPATAPGALKQRLAGSLTASRGIIALVILTLSFVGAAAYLAAIILGLIGVITDVLDSKLRRYSNQQGLSSREYDLRMDTLLVLSGVVYCSLSGIVISTVVGLFWVGLAAVTITVYKAKRNILMLFEVPSILALAAIAAIYNFMIFALLVVPVVAIAVIIGWERISTVVTQEWPKLFRD